MTRVPQPVLYDEWWQEPDAGDQSIEDGHHEFWDDVMESALDVDLSGKKILDFGCGQGGLLRRVYRTYKFKEAIGVDLARQSIATANSRKGDLPIEYLALADINSLDTDFDYAVSTAVIYLIDDIAAHARQIYDRLKPGGIYFATHPDYVTDPKFKVTIEAIDTFGAVKCAHNSLDDIVRAFESVGFKVFVKRIVPTGYIPVPVSFDSRWYGSATNEIDYWYGHRYSFKCRK